LSVKLGNNEIALAIELRQEGCTWKVIAYGLSVNPNFLCCAVNKAKREGMKDSSRVTIKRLRSKIRSEYWKKQRQQIGME